MSWNQNILSELRKTDEVKRSYEKIIKNSTRLTQYLEGTAKFFICERKTNLLTSGEYYPSEQDSTLDLIFKDLSIPIKWEKEYNLQKYKGLSMMGLFIVRQNGNIEGSVISETSVDASMICLKDLVFKNALPSGNFEMEVYTCIVNPQMSGKALAKLIKASAGKFFDHFALLCTSVFTWDEIKKKETERSMYNYVKLCIEGERNLLVYAYAALSISVYNSNQQDYSLNQKLQVAIDNKVLLCDVILRQHILRIENEGELVTELRLIEYFELENGLEPVCITVKSKHCCAKIFFKSPEDKEEFKKNVEIFIKNYKNYGDLALDGVVPLEKLMNTMKEMCNKTS